jgi:hypothetical protein
MSTLEVVDNSIPNDETAIMNITYDKDQFMEPENRSDVMGLPGILATSIILGLMTLTTIIGKKFGNLNKNPFFTLQGYLP